MRLCERCNSQMALGRPRVRRGNQLWCQTCAKNVESPSGRYRPGSDIDVTASLNEHEKVLEGMAPIPETQVHQRTLTEVHDDDPLYHPHRRTDTERLLGTGSLEAPMTTVAMNAKDDTGERYAYVNLPPLEAAQAGRNLLQQAAKALGMHKVAHDSGDGQTIYHCPFCGSGQVIARSDKTIECEFCHTSFTVQVQPEYSAFPQTMNGQPVQVPGMPGQIDQPVGGSGQDPTMPGAPDPTADADQDGVPDAQDPDANGDGFNDADPASANNQPPWLKSGLKTTAGRVLPFDEYVRHLAIKHADADERPAVLRTVRASRGQ